MKYIPHWPPIPKERPPRKKGWGGFEKDIIWPPGEKQMRACRPTVGDGGSEI